MWHSLAYCISRFLSRCILGLIGELHILHAEKSALPGAFILAANHISHFDPPILTVASRRKIDWMAMRELFEKTWTALYFRSVDTFPTERGHADRSAVRTTLQRLKRGHVVGIFPEGGIRAGSVSILEGAPVSPSLAGIAEAAGVPILPCVIIGSDRLYDRRNWFPFRRTHFWVGFGDVLKPETKLGKVASREKLGRELAEIFPKLYAEMRAHFSLAPDDLPQIPQRRMES